MSIINPASSALKYFREVATEMKNVSFPSRYQVIRNTAVVLVAMIVATVIFGLLDAGFVQAVKVFIIDRGK